MSDLLNKKCVPCEGGIIPFDISEIHKYQKKVDGWDIIKDKKKKFYLNKKFKFKNFLDSQNFINRVGEISENEGHHPDILFGWGYAEIKITTHAIEGLSENDFILAAKNRSINQCLKCLVFERLKLYQFHFAKLIISLSLMDPEGCITAVTPD
jgi:4a-hydroxytetrahydrobiopterin dehydratase